MKGHVITQLFNVNANTLADAIMLAVWVYMQKRVCSEYIYVMKG